MAMHEATIKYEDEKVLEVLASLSEHLGFTITDPKSRITYVNGLRMEMGDPSIEIETLNGVFADTDARELRRSAWKRER